MEKIRNIDLKKLLSFIVITVIILASLVWGIIIGNPEGMAVEASTL
ncbi:hypothetical protein H8D57_00975 [bacterium]|nr:hypothetical protein [bacterium]